MLNNPRQQVAFIGITVFLAGFSLASIINFTNPYTASKFTHAFFYLSLFLFVVGLTTLVGLTVRQIFSPKLFILNLRASFRQGLLLAILTIVSIGLLVARILFWWVELSLILFFLCVEVLLNLKI